MKNEKELIKKYETTEAGKQHYARLAYQNSCFVTEEEVEEMLSEDRKKQAESEAKEENV